MGQLFKNNAKSALAASLASGATSLTVQTTHGARFPALTSPDFFMATLQDATNVEIVKVTARASDVFTIERAQEGTTSPATFASGTIVSLRMTAAAVEAMLAHPALATAAHAATAISNTPAGNIAATTVQAALNELDSEKTTLAAATAAATTEANTAVSNHVGAADPHTQYATNTELTDGLAAKQAADATLTGLAALVIALNEIPVGSGPDTFSKLTLDTDGTLAANSDVKLATQKAVKTYADAAVLASPRVGLSQTWQDMTASRAFATTYTNSTGRPIEVLITVNCGPNEAATLTVSGVVIANMLNGTGAAAGVYLSTSAIVPAGGTYVLINTLGVVDIVLWAELR